MNANISFFFSFFCLVPKAATNERVLFFFKGKGGHEAFSKKQEGGRVGEG